MTMTARSLLHNELITSILKDSSGDRRQDMKFREIDR